MHRPVATAGMALALAATLALAACTAGIDDDDAGPVPGVTVTSGGSGSAGVNPGDASADVRADASADASAADVGQVFDRARLHTVAIEMDDADYQDMLDAYVATGKKEWVRASVVIDGVGYEDVGVRLKGNSTLRGLAQAIGDARRAEQAASAGASASSSFASPSPAEASAPDARRVPDLSPEHPEALPWRIKLDQFVPGQTHGGEAELVVRGGNTRTALNEGVTLALLAETGLAFQAASSARLSVNGGPQALRLIVQNPDDDGWYRATFGGDGLLFEAESGGDYSYRGADFTAYLDAFDIKANPADVPAADGYAPLVAFLGFLADADDATFRAELDRHLDVAAFARYLAFQDLVRNPDDIDGPGNNSYLAYDPGTGRLTVVAWDHNLALGGASAGGVRARPSDHPLVGRFQADPGFAELIAQAAADIQAQFLDSGFAAGVLEEWTALLRAEASDLVPGSVIEAESRAVARELGLPAGGE